MATSTGFKQFGVIFSLSILLVGYQNCTGKDGVGKSFASYQAGVIPANAKGPIAPNPTLPPGTTPTPTPAPADSAEGKLDPACATNKAYSACLFYKNPVAQNNAPIPGLSYDSDLSKLQTYGVTLTGLNTSGFLENSSITVKISSGTRAKVNAAGDWKFDYKSDPAHRVGQVMAYFWLNKQLEHMTNRSGVMYTKNKGITVDALDEGVANNAYWSTENNQITMGYFAMAGPKTEAALSAEIYLHEMGHANITNATNGSTDDDANSSGCRCFTEGGCMAAINEGQADFHAAIIFPDKPQLGEAAFNNLDGLVEGGLPRDVRKLKNLTVSDAFSASGGECHIMGRIYAATWWEVYNARSTDAEKKDIEKLFSEHLKTLTGKDKFAQTRDKIVATDKALFAGKYGSFFKAEFSRRGVP